MSILWEQMLYQGNFLSDIFSVSLPRNSIHMYNLVKTQSKGSLHYSSMCELLANQRAGGEASYRKFLSFLDDMGSLMRQAGMADRFCADTGISFQVIDTIREKTCAFCKEVIHGSLVDALVEAIKFHDDYDVHVPAFFESYAKGERAVSRVLQYVMCEECYQTICSDCHRDCSCGQCVCTMCATNCGECNNVTCNSNCFHCPQICEKIFQDFCENANCKSSDYCDPCGSWR